MFPIKKLLGINPYSHIVSGNIVWVIDLGPEGGDQGGKIIAEGTPQNIAKIKSSYTGQYLAKIL